MSVRRLIQASPLFPYANIVRRMASSFRSHIGPTLGYWVKWLIASREDTNLTYNLSDVGRQNLASGIGYVLNLPRSTVESYFEELEKDKRLSQHIARATRDSLRSGRSDLEIRFGKRLAWYALTRAIKPSVIVETGVDKGLGSVVLCAALLKNAAEGAEGQYYGTDLNPDAGHLLGGIYSSVGRILYGDSIESLENLDVTVDMFINDSDHSAEYEAREYKTILPKLAQDALIIGDNSHVTTRLSDFASEQGWRYVFLAEHPLRHWYPGGGLGLAHRVRLGRTGWDSFK